MLNIKKGLFWIFFAFIIVIMAINIGFNIFYSNIYGYIVGILYSGGVFWICRKYSKSEKLQNIKSVYIIGVLIVVGFALRLGYANFSKAVPVSDYATMFQASKAYAAGNNPFVLGSYFHRFTHMTTFTYVCGLLFKTFGVNLYLIKIISIVMSCICIVLMYFISKKLFGKNAGILSAVLYTFLPPSIAYCSVFATENFAMPFLMLSLYLVICAYKSEKIRNAFIYMAISGIVLSVGCLFRSVWPFYISAYLISVIILFKGVLKKLSVVALLLTFVIVTQLVSNYYYNTGVTQYKLEKSAVPYSVYVLVGLNYETNGAYNAEDQVIYYEVNGDTEKMNEVVKERIVERIKENSFKLIPLMFIKTAMIFGQGEFNGFYWSYGDEGMAYEHPERVFFYNIASIYFVMLLIGILYVLRRYKYSGRICLLSLLILGFEAGLMLMEIQARYSYSVVFVFVIIASAFVFEDLEKKKEKVECDAKEVL